MRVSSMSLPLVFILMTASISGFATPLVFEIKDINAPHPRHCVDERQWMDPSLFTPFALFGGQEELWIPCSYAIKDAGYTVEFVLSSPIEIDGFSLSQSLVEKSVPPPKKLKRGQPTDRPRRQFKRLQVLFFNQEISPRYPLYYQDVNFDGQADVKLEYRELLAWNHNLIGDSQFDERRRYLGLSPSGIMPPIKIDRFAIVFWEFEGEGAPAALSSMTFHLDQKTYHITGREKSQDAYSTVMGKLYDVMLRDYLLLGEERTLLFSVTGTLWGMEGEEETPKVIGAWRFNKGRIEVDLSPQQKGRINAKRRQALEKQRDKYFTPLHLIVDEAPERLMIKDGPLQGDYEAIRPPVPTQPLSITENEVAPPFEAP